MSPDLDAVKKYCVVSESEQRLLLSNRRPIVLLRKRDMRLLSDFVSPNNDYIGCMLPYTPLHHLLFRQPVKGDVPSQEPNFRALIMTSGNLAEEPIVRDNDGAREKLAGIVDGFLLHNRDIFMRADDSVVRVQSSEFKVQSNSDAKSSGMRFSSPNDKLRTMNYELSFIRRARGYAPLPIYVNRKFPPLLAVGAHLKNTVAISAGERVIIRSASRISVDAVGVKPGSRDRGRGSRVCKLKT